MRLKRILMIAVQTLLVVAACYAIPAKREWHKVLLECGDSVLVSMVGDEHCHYLATEDGTPVEEVTEGVYRLAPETLDGRRAQWAERAKARNAHRLEKSAKTRAQAQAKLHKAAFGYPTQFKGQFKGVVILVNFTDKSFKATSTVEAFENRFNKVGFNENNHVGSVHDYFYDQSYGQFDLTFDVFGPVTLSQNVAYYGENDKNDNDLRPAVLVEEACKLVKMKYNVNWSNYDWDGDGYVDQVYLIYAGPGEHATGNSRQIWPHESTMNEEADYGDGNGEFSLGGVKINTYAMSCELVSEKSSTIDGIGTACHEFSHCMGLPDVYDVGYSGGFGMSYWDLMDSGSYSGATGRGEAPCGYTAYERWFCGWLDFTELDKSCTITDMPSLMDEPIAYIIYNKGDKDEYFTLENRQNEKWFKYVHTTEGIHGMLVTHVDFDQDAWCEDMVNSDKKHQRMSPIPADNSYGMSTRSGYSVTTSELRGDLFPGSKKVTALSSTSHEKTGGKLFSPNTDGSYHINKTISNITENEGKISFTFKDDSAPSAINDISLDGDEEYYTLSGIRTDKPTARGVYIVKKGDRVQRMLIGR